MQLADMGLYLEDGELLGTGMKLLQGRNQGQLPFLPPVVACTTSMNDISDLLCRSPSYLVSRLPGCSSVPQPPLSCVWAAYAKHLCSRSMIQYNQGSFTQRDNICLLSLSAHVLHSQTRPEIAKNKTQTRVRM